MGTVIASKEKNEVSTIRKSASKLELYRLLVDELIKDEPNKSKVREYCKFLKIPYSLNSAAHIGTVFNRLQSLNRQVINE